MRIRIFRGDKTVDVVALVNSGYEADSPQLMVPIQVARELGLWPPVDVREGNFRHCRRAPEGLDSGEMC
ncbi:MAG: hypothetical protein ACPL09_02545 [Candidatus Methanodesulfokora sp.]